MPVKLNSSGGGSVTLTTPSTASDFTVTVPAVTGSALVSTSGASTSSTGIDFPSANTVAIKTNGTTAVTVDSSQNVGIGTSTPYAKLDIVNGMLRIAANQSTSGTLDLSADTSAAYIKANYWASAVPLTFYTGGSERARIDSSGRLLLNNTSSVTNSYFQATADLTAANCIGLKDTATTYSTGSTYVVFSNSSNASAGSIQHTAVTTVAYGTTSDIRLKENIVDAPSGINTVINIPVRSYDWKEDKAHVHFGFVAQELADVYSEAVCVGGDDVNKNPWNVEYGRLTPLLVKAIQELSAKLDAAEARIAALEAK